MARRYLLSIDGGGIRGIIPTIALVKLERDTGRLTRETFSFVAGTSTGAVIAAAIAAGMPATRILDLYLNRSREIFTRRLWNIPRRVIMGSMYSTQTLHDIIADELGPAREWTLNDSPIDLLITSKRLSDGIPWYFVRDRPQNSGRTGRLRLVDCATASAAAPTYFQPWTIHEDPATLPPDWDPVGTLVDGGVGVAGNPVYQTCVEAFFYTDAYRPEESLMVSLGTGRLMDRTRPTWIGSWLEWILAELLRSPGEQQTQIVYRHFPQMPLYRLDPDFHDLDPGRKINIPLDDVGSIDRLVRYGEQFAERIDWPAILEGRDTTFRIAERKTMSYQYSWP